MAPERWAEIDRLLDEALTRPPAERDAFLAAACADDEPLRQEVASLLAAHDKAAAEFLTSPAVEVAAQHLAAQANPSLVGQTLGPYSVLSVLGAGGMGEVYLARDTRLTRKLALKLLPAEFTRDAARIKRFEREARAASALNHPNIITIYEIGVYADKHFIAAEYVEGQTLRERLRRGGLPLKEALEITGQIAAALAAAHEAGIIHRDIKPENVMVRPDGYVKVLDFGLAKLTEQWREAHRTRNSTADLARTNPGVVMGTVSYMSPEQAQGKEIDQRSDIFSCGVLLYELVTGTLPFKGNSTASILDAIVQHTPLPPTKFNSQLPGELDTLLARALEKERAQRYQTADEWREDLKRLQRQLETASAARPSNPNQQPVAPVVESAKRPWKWLAPALALLGIGFASIWLWRAWSNQPVVSSTNEWTTAQALQLTDQAGLKGYPSLTPDGKIVVYAAQYQGDWDIWWQRVDGGQALNLTWNTSEDQADDTQPAFSPNGETIAFRSERAGGGIFSMGATGENIRRLTHEGYNPAWSPDGQEIAYASESAVLPTQRHLFPSPLKAFKLADGTTRVITQDDAMQPAWSPQGKRIAYWSIVHAGGQRDIWTISAQGGQPVRVTDDPALDWNPVWSRDGKYLYFISNRGGTMNLWRVALDETTGQRLGEFEPVRLPADYSKHLGFSGDGRRLAYVQERRRSNLLRLAFDPVKGTVSGAPQWITQGARSDFGVFPSPDEKLLVWYAGEQQEDLLIGKVDGSDQRKLTNDAAHDRAPRWWPDGSRIVFYSDRTGNYEVWSIKPDGTGLQQLTWGGSEFGGIYPIPSPDGSRMVFRALTGGAFLLDATQPWQAQRPQQLPPLQAPNLHFSPWSWSPDGQKLVGIAGPEDSQPGIVIYDLATRRYETLTQFGKRPMWLNDQRRLIFFSDSKLYLLDMATKKSQELSAFAPNTISRVSLAPDNRHLYVTLNLVEADVWMLSQE